MGSHSRDVAVAQASTQLDVNISGSFKIVYCQLKTKASGQKHCFYFTHITSIMTFWADNIKFIKDIQDSKYKKIEDCIAELGVNTQRSNREELGWLNTCPPIQVNN